MNKYHVVMAVAHHDDDWGVIGVFTKENDAAEFIADQEKSGKFACVVRPQLLEMPVIIDLLVRDRLKEIAEPLIKLLAREKAG